MSLIRYQSYAETLRPLSPKVSHLFRGVRAHGVQQTDVEELHKDDGHGDDDVLLVIDEHAPEQHVIVRDDDDVSQVTADVVQQHRHAEHGPVHVPRALHDRGPRYPELGYRRRAGHPDPVVGGAHRPPDAQQ